MSDVVLLSNDVLSAQFVPLGAELVSLRDAAGRELMTDADPAYWTGHAPILFPIVGRLEGDRYRVGGQEYSLPQHGFARRREFVIETQGADHIVFRLDPDDESLAAYPFRFVLHVEHRLVGATLFTTVTATNAGTEDMPASVGFHPAFAWPLPYGGARDEHRIEFDREEPGDIAVIAPGGTIAADTAPSPLEGRVLTLDDTLFANDALVWDPVVSRSVRYGAKQGPQLRVDFPEMGKLGIWTKPGAAFVCIEPWAGIADPQGFAGDIFEKPGIHRIAPGVSRHFGMSVTLVP